MIKKKINLSTNTHNEKEVLTGVTRRNSTPLYLFLLKSPMHSKQSLASTLFYPWATFEYNFLKWFLQFFLISFYDKALSIFLTFKLFFPDFLEFDFILTVLGDQWGVVKQESGGAMESDVLNLMLALFPHLSSPCPTLCLD